jgi:hypothetical protein
MTGPKPASNVGRILRVSLRPTKGAAKRALALGRR